MEPKSLSLDQKVGQLFVYGANGRFMNAASPEWQKMMRLVEKDAIGGVVWFGADILETAWMNAELQRVAPFPLLIGADLEAGIGMRFGDATYWPSAMALAATGDPALAESAGRTTAVEALAVGINHIYAPVADVNSNPDNPVINVRSFGEDPAEVSRFVAAFVRGVQSTGALATVKHFPGHGDTATDSHRSLPMLDASRERLDRVELIPFRAAVAAGVASVMTGHIALPQLDPETVPVRALDERDANPYAVDASEVTARGTVPASLSRAVTTDLLRNALGFKGLILTDAIDMGGISQHFDQGEASVRAIAAGADQILKSADIDAAMEGVRNALRTGRLTEARIDESVARVFAYKNSIPVARFDPAAISRVFDAPEHRAVAAEIAAKAVTLLREEAGALPLRREQKVVELVVSDFPEAAPPVPGFFAGLRGRLAPPPQRFFLDQRSVAAEADSFLAAAANADVVVLSLMVRTRSGAGQTGVPAAARVAIEQLLAQTPPKRVIAISFGNPYVIRELPALPTYLVTYGPQPVMQQAVARALFGDAPITGKLPVTIPGLFERGSGIDRK
ncbi:MAG TPA: glycoside hydrolase family 3 N-terminal domain-containing protein [Thermoanaerobaculia bacterium]|nr:glycoside hydrolase family 3 N-terminal domain-containing protein [Thermoanaerobaculia bacterium]